MTESHSADVEMLDESNPLDKIVLYALDEAMEKLEQSGEMEPFTIVLHDENLHIESHPGENAVECFNSASAAVKNMAHVMDAYVFVYDGYVTTDSSTRDAIIVERGTADGETAEVFAVLYTEDESGDGSLTFEEGICALGPASSILEEDTATAEDLEEL